MDAGIDPDMALTPLPSSIGQGSNPQPSECKPSALTTDHSFHCNHKQYNKGKSIDFSLNFKTSNFHVFSSNLM